MKYCKLDKSIWGSRSASRLTASLAVLILFAGILGLPQLFSDSRGSRFVRLDFVPESLEGAHQKQGRYILTFDGAVSAKICRESSIPLFYADILGAKIAASPFLMNFERGPVKMARLMQISEDPAVMRATFFLKKTLSPKIKYLQNSMEIEFSALEAEKPQDKHNSYSLIEPASAGSAVKQSPGKLASAERCVDSPERESTRLTISNSDAATVMRELAKQASKSIHFRDPVQCRIEIDTVAGDPEEALRQVSDKSGYILTVEDGDYWISRRENPLLRISDQAQVEGADLSNLALGDVLKALGQIAEVNIGLDGSLDGLKEKKVSIYFQKISLRRALETLLKVHELVLTIVDEKTLLVMTVANARQIEGKVVRILPLKVPYEKLQTVIAEMVSSEITTRVKTQEDLGNIILTGDREAVDIYETAVRSLEGKMLSAGESFRREYFHPLNTKPEDMIALIKENLGEKETVKVSFDKRTDMMLVSGPEASVERTLDMMKKLDHDPTRQALIHIRLIEISRKDLETIGVKLPDQLVSTADIKSFSASSIVVPANFTAFQDNNRVKTLANPTLRCMDKEEASIDISEQIPIKNTTTNYFAAAAASMSVSTSDNWTTSDVGIKLNVQPFIHKDNEITMKVDIDLTELLSLVEGHPWTAKRNIKTMVRVKDSETVVIGGLIRNKKTNNRRPIPILSRIPLIRKLAKRLEHNEDSYEKAEMIILITPNVVNSSGLSRKDSMRADIVPAGKQGD